jgi:hypothetical protein
VFAQQLASLIADLRTILGDECLIGECVCARVCVERESGRRGKGERRRQRGNTGRQATRKLWATKAHTCYQPPSHTPSPCHAALNPKPETLTLNPKP